jgi:hypothetical protein
LVSCALFMAYTEVIETKKIGIRRVNDEVKMINDELCLI